jgi:hypothetical protein
MRQKKQCCANLNIFMPLTVTFNSAVQTEGTVLPLQRLLHEPATILRYTYTVYVFRQLQCMKKEGWHNPGYGGGIS